MNWFSFLNLEWVVMLTVALIGFSAFVGCRVHWSVAPFLALATISGLWTFGYRFDRFAEDPSIEALLVGRESAYASLCLVVVSGYFAMAPRRLAELIPGGLTAVFFGACACVLFRAGNDSMNGALVAVTLPVALKYFAGSAYPVRMRPTVLLGLWALYAAHASVPYGVMAVVILALSIAAVVTAARISETPFKTLAIWFLGALVLAGSALAVGAYTQGDQFLSSTGRFQEWHFFFDRLAAQGQWALGFGTGTGAALFPAIGRANNSLVFTFAHNDWLQVFFENGFIGVWAVVVVYLYALKHAVNRPWLFASIAGYGANAFFNFPTHHAVHAFVGASLLWLSHKER